LEPISYLRAPIRRWPVLIPFVLVCMLVAFLIPVSTPSSAFATKTYKADSEVGLAPGDKSNKLGAKLGRKQLEYYAHLPAVIDAAARAQGVPVTKKLPNLVVIGKAKPSKQAQAAAKGGGGGGGKKEKASGNILEIAVLQPTKDKAVGLTNAFVKSLSAYTQIQISASNKSLEYENQVYISNLQDALAALVPAKPTTPTTIKPATTVPKVTRHKVKRTVIRPPVTSTTAKSSLGAPGHSAQLTAFRLDDAAATPSVPTPSPVAGLVPTSLPGTTPAAGVTTTTAPRVSPTVKAERAVLTKQLANALAKQQLLMSQIPPKTGIQVIAPAKHAQLLNPKPTSSLLSRHSVRLALGFLIGLILGILATWLLDGLDRRLRTTKRAEEVFRLPVFSEIPVGSNSTSAIPVVDIVVDPYSPVSEAYRKLYVAILTAPAVTWVKRGGSGLEPAELAPARPLVSAPAGAGAAMAGSPQDSPVAEGRYPAPVGTMDLVSPRRHRFAILITSPNDEPSRSLAVVNLATVFAEAGDRVLVATTGGMRTEFEGDGKGLRGWEGEVADTDASELVANARPSQIPGVSSLALGSLYSNPARLALKAGSLIEAARDVVDVFLIEAPLLSTQDGAALLPVVDLVVVVCESWHTTVQDGLRTQKLLTQRRPPVLGLVMTNMQKDQLSKPSR
jgi:capsular polysaccharide biosynthesis protein